MATFRLASVLKLRRHHEDRRQRDLAAALAVENEQKDTAMRYARMRQEQAERVRRWQRVAGELDVRALIDHRAYVGLLDREIQEKLRCVARAEHETVGRRAKLVEAMVDRKALEVLQERAADDERTRRDRAETAEIDEVALRVHAVATAGADA